MGDYQSPFGFTGIIDELAVYHRALSPAEIATRFASPGTRALQDTAVLSYSFDDGKATDGSGKGNDGEIGGAEPVEGKVGQALRFVNRPRNQAAVVYDWTRRIPLHVRAMTLAGGTLLIAGPPDLVDEEEVLKRPDEPEIIRLVAEQVAALNGERGAVLQAVSIADGTVLGEVKLDVPPTFDGMAAAYGKVYLSTVDGKVVCLGG